MLTNEEIASVFAMYWQSKYCKVYPESNLDTSKTTFSVLGSASVWSKQQIENRKLLLTPLSKISDEDAIEVKNLLRAASTVWEIEEYTTKDIANYLLEKGLYMYSHCFQYLISKSYAVPIFFAPNHPDNGKTAIELDLARDKTNPIQKPTIK